MNIWPVLKSHQMLQIIRRESPLHTTCWRSSACGIFDSTGWKLFSSTFERVLVIFCPHGAWWRGTNSGKLCRSSRCELHGFNIGQQAHSPTRSNRKRWTGDRVVLILILLHHQTTSSDSFSCMKDVTITDTATWSRIRPGPSHTHKIGFLKSCRNSSF